LNRLGGVDRKKKVKNGGGAREKRPYRRQSRRDRGKRPTHLVTRSNPGCELSWKMKEKEVKEDWGGPPFDSRLKT